MAKILLISLICLASPVVLAQQSKGLSDGDYQSGTNYLQIRNGTPVGCAGGVFEYVSEQITWGSHVTKTTCSLHSFSEISVNVIKATDSRNSESIYLCRNYTGLSNFTYAPCTASGWQETPDCVGKEKSTAPYLSLGFCRKTP
jgi:hypothetical protein